MNKIAKIASGVGAVAMLGVAALPLTSYAATTVDETVNVEVGAVCALVLSGTTSAVATAPGVINATPDNTTLFTNANVLCNNAAGYTLTMKAKTAADVNLVGQESSRTLPAKGTAPVSGTESYSWHTGTNWATPSTTAVNVASTSAPSAVAGDNYKINYGVGTAANTAADTYESTITYTITAK